LKKIPTAVTGLEKVISKLSSPKKKSSSGKFPPVLSADKPRVPNELNSSVTLPSIVPSNVKNPS
jgi:hypothetical protein